MKAPSELRVSSDRKLLTVTFPEDTQFSLTAEMLRVMSPSAEVKGHSPDQRVVVSGKENVTIVGLEPVGHYAIRITFSDGHSTGLYTWGYLAQLGRDKDTRWQAYLEELAAKGLSRAR